MKKFFLLSVLIFPLLVFCAILRTPENLFQVENMKFGLMHWDANWKCTSQFSNPSVVNFLGEGAVATGEGLRKDGNFRVANGEFQLGETIQTRSGNEMEIRYQLSSESGIPSRLLAWGAEFPEKDYPLAACRIGGQALRWQAGKPEQQFRLSKDRPFQMTLKNGILELSGNLVLLIRYPDHGRETPTLRLAFSHPPEAPVHDAELKFKIRYLPFQTAMLDFKSEMTMGLADEVANDRQGGWTDQGPENDLRALAPGIHEFAGIPFDIVNPAQNGGKATLAFRGGNRPWFQESAEISIPPGTQGKYLYLLNGVAWAPAKDKVCGIAEMEYTDGTSSGYELKCGIDTGDFWMPKHLKNAYAGWRNFNSQSNIGLYVTRIPLAENKSVRKLTLRSANEVWMVLAATVTSAEWNRKETFVPVTLQTDSEWMNFDDSMETEKGSVLDCSFLLDAPAGKYGFVKAVGENFEFEKKPGRPVRFWGTNVNSTAITLPDERLELLLNMLEAQGCNLLRLHHFDWMLFNANSSLKSDVLERLDYLLAGAKKRGIYVTIDLLTARSFPGTVPKWEFYVNPGFRSELISSMMQLLNHENRYTGMAWKDDPALAFINVINEGTFSFQYWRASAEQKKQIEPMFLRYAEEQGWNPAEKRNVRLGIWLRHMAATAYRDAVRQMRNEGVRVPFCDQNFRMSPSVALTRRQYDYVDSHFYWGHPTFLGERQWQPPYMVNPGSSIPTGGAINEMFGVRLLGKPFTVTEWNYCYPNPRGAEGPFLAGAYSALQNFSGLTQFTASDRAGGLNGKGPIGPFDGAVNPILRLGMRAGAFFFLRGDVAASRLEIPAYLPENYWEFPEFQLSKAPETIGLIAKTGLVFQPDHANWKGIIYPAAVPLPRNGNAFHADHIQAALSKLLADGILPEGSWRKASERFVSSTGELILDRKQEIFQSVSPASESFVLPGGKEGAGKFATIFNEKTDASFLVASLAGPLEKSGRILILHLTDVKNDGSVFRDPRLIILEKNGSGRKLIRRGRAKLTINLPFPGILFACDATGKRLFKVPPAFEKGLTTFELNTDSGDIPILVYELVRK